MYVGLGTASQCQHAYRLQGRTSYDLHLGRKNGEDDTPCTGSKTLSTANKGAQTTVKVLLSNEVHFDKIK